MSHTPGPWKIVRGGTYYYPLMIEDTNGYEVVSFHTWDKAKDSKAHLIAAAPTMKEALEEVLNYSAISDSLDIDLEKCRKGTSGYHPNVLRALHMAKKALTLANGKDKEP